MPVYEYHCQDCGQLLTIRRSLSETSQPRCSACGSGNLNRLISPVSIVKSVKDRTRDLSWIDKDVAHRLRSKARGKLSPGSEETLNWMESK
jgi:putative FmdB family regulatory protein